MPAGNRNGDVRPRRLACLGGAAALGLAVSLGPSLAQTLPQDAPAASDRAGTASDTQFQPADGSLSSPDGITAGGLRGFQDGTAVQDGTATTASTGPGTDAAAGATTAASAATSPADAVRTAAIPAVSGTQPPDNRNGLGRINLRERPIGGRAYPPPPAPLDRGPGIRIGSFILRPEVTQGIGAESQTYADGTHSSRTYSQTRIRGTLASDWSRHALTISGSGTYQKNISGTGETRPTADISADLRLDLAQHTTADFTAGYNFYRESVTDPNAVAGAANQAAVNIFTGGAELSRDLGRLRGSLAAKAIRTTYGDVRLTDGTTLSQSDRDTLAGEFAARVGYQLSGALTPFVQAKYRRTSYDNGTDSAGYRRSSDTYTAEAGLTADLGEKLSGELAAGYVLRRYEDARLADVGGLALDATGRWSPHRGTDISLNLASQLEESTTPGVSGPIAYSVGTAITQQVRDDVVARLAAQYLYRDYRQNGSQPDQQVYTISTGLSWYLNRTFSLDAELAFARTVQKGAHDQDVATVDIGLTARR